ncbi:MAG: hypothetical protein JST79_15845 [Acidobacteria bacterium]|nr:hypothetical protein [Acidobacteriota bacterium]
MAQELRLFSRPAQLPEPTLRALLAVLFRQGRLFRVCFVLIFAAIGLYGLLAPSYEAHMKILLQKNRVDPMLTPTPTPLPAFARQEITEEEVNSETEILDNEDILRAVVQEASLDGPPNWLPRFREGPDGERRLARAVRRLKRDLQITPLRKTNLILVRYAAADPQQAARVLRALAAAYLKFHRQNGRPSGEAAFFEEQLEIARQDLERAQTRWLSYTREQDVVSAAQERDLAVQQLSEREADTQRTRVALAETAQRISTLENRLRALPERTTSEIRNLDNPELMGKMKAHLLELELKRTELLTKFTPTYRLVQETEQEIAQTKAAIAQEEQTPLRDETTQPDANYAWAKSELLKSQVEFATLAAHAKAADTALAGGRRNALALNEQVLRQQDLWRDFKTAEDRYVLYATKREEARIGDALDQGGILNVTLADPPVVPALPLHSAWFYGFLGLVAAGGVSTGLVFAADYLDPAFRTPEEILAYLGTPVLASLPRQDDL